MVEEALAIGSALDSATTRALQKTQPSETYEVAGKIWAAFTHRVGRRYAGCRLDNFQLAKEEIAKGQQERVLFALKSFANKIRQNVEDGRNVILYGPPGTGKDHLLVALMALALREFVPAGTPNYPETSFRLQWVSGMDLFASVRDSFDSKERTETSEVRAWCSPSILAISDPVPPFGPLTNFQAAHLLRIIDGRYRDQKPTWVTLNVANREEAETRIGPQVLDRLRDGSLVSFCNWPSFRTPIAKEKA